MTDNHNYNEPDQGQVDWDVPLNANFRDIDTDVEVRDTEANRSNYTPKNGAKFFATDTGKIYLGDGANWNELLDDEAEQRKEAYRDGPSVTIETTQVDSASKTGSDAEYGEVSMPLRDGWRLEVFEAGAGDDDASATSEAQIIVATDADDTGTYTQIYSTADTDAVPEDGSGNIDYSSTLVTHDNTTGMLNRVFFRAVNTDSGSSTIAVWGNFTVIRRPIP